MSSNALRPPSPLTSQLWTTLSELAGNPYPEVPSPANVGKRASVALIIRIQPEYAHWHGSVSRTGRHDSTSANSSVQERIDEFFGQEWVQHGDPEVLFIKRAAREGDRWTSHVALPGGRRDPEDESDSATAIRETFEEVGIDLRDTFSIPVGNLPQRLVTTSWGKVPLMILCPYVFLLTMSDIPPLRLQPTEINSTHWVSLRAILSPELRTYEYQDVSNRLAKQEGGIKRWFLRAMLGQMLFAAIRLVPSESKYCSSVPDFLPTGSKGNTPWLVTKISYAPSTAKPLLLWGLTLGIMADFLELLPPHNAIALWRYPTFSPLDVRFTLWAMSYSFKKRKRRELEEPRIASLPAVEQGLDAVSPPPAQLGTERYVKPAEVGIGGLGIGCYYGRERHNSLGSRSSAVSLMLEGYYDIVRQAVAIALLGRVSCIGALAFAMWYRYKRR